MSRKTLADPKHEHLDDELLSNVHGGTAASGGKSPGGQGPRPNGGDGLGWLRNLLRTIFR